jgi:hypothetical protein
MISTDFRFKQAHESATNGKFKPKLHYIATNLEFLLICGIIQEITREER